MAENLEGKEIPPSEPPTFYKRIKEIDFFAYLEQKKEKKHQEEAGTGKSLEENVRPTNSQ